MHDYILIIQQIGQCVIRGRERERSEGYSKTEAWRGLLVILGLVLMMIDMQGRGSVGQLVEKLYSSTCPNVESIVKQAVSTKLSQTPIGQPPVTIPATLRLFFRDCFIEGCDASIMIASPNGDAEKDYSDNLSLAGDGFHTAVKAKQAVEAQFPGVVSCDDILALAARDVVVLAGGPAFNVELGRQDGLFSKASRVPGKLPEPSFNMKQLNTMFAEHNVSQTDVIALSGAHTLGFSHCSSFANRLYPFSPSFPVEPSLDPNYAKKLMSACPQDVDRRISVNMDPQTPQAFDNACYRNLVAGRGLFTSDAVLFTNSASKPTVIDFANNPGNFNGAFTTSMRKYGRVGVKTGKLVIKGRRGKTAPPSITVIPSWESIHLGIM